MSKKQLNVVSLEELAKHNTEESAWIAVDGKVYDVTDFLDGHPGGKRILMTVLGKDATSEFYQFHKAAPIFGKYDARLVIGVVKGQEPSPVEYNVDGVFGDGIAFGDPAWYQEWKSPYYKDSHRRLRAWIRKIVEEELIPFIPHVYKRFGELGFLNGITGTVPWPSYATSPPPVGIKPEEWDVFHELVLGDELARCASSGVASAITLGPSIALPPIIHFAPKFMQDKIIKPVLSGDKTIALAITEPYAGSDVANITATAVLTPDGKHYIVNGEKKWIVMSGNVGSGTAYLTFDNVKIPKENIIGQENKGFKRLGIVTSSLRFARVCYEEAMKHANQRRTFGQLLFEHGVIRNKLAHMARQIEATQAWMEFLTFQLQGMAPEEAALKLGGPIALLKAQATVTIEYCAREASQILGGIAYTRTGKGAIVERIYRDVRGFAIPGGSEEIMLGMRIIKILFVSIYLGIRQV
ncbi:acyl-CoA dehydrogenase/oxidase [Chytridium lagenaria]|nr:acyl-CoA dehydrogenase/oxidase [Chytridium lagenaria]